MHPSSIWGDYSIGSLGKEAFEFVDFLSDSGFGVWQTLPFCITDEFNSPYKSPASFSLNPYFIDLPTLFDKGYITYRELLSARGKIDFYCEFERLREERCPLLIKAAKRALCSEDVRISIGEFAEKNPRIKKASEYLAEKFDTDADVWQFLHLEFFEEWMKVKKYANQNGISIIGDVPIYVSPESADVLENPQNFLLDGEGKPLEVAGVPPDYFSSEGQLWGNPIYDYGMMEKDSFSWWRERIRHALSLFDGIRIDHFRGIDAFWSVPNGKDAREGRWKSGPGEKLVKAIIEEAGERLIIAEDLGDIDDSVRRLISKYSLAGSRVFEFAFLGDSESVHLPHNYINNSVAYSSTHDNNTLLGYLFECEEGTRRRIFEYCGYSGSDITEGERAVIRTLFSSSAGIVILPIQDVLFFGSDTRMNTPGKADGNWGFRIRREQIYSSDRAFFRYLSALYARL